MSDVVALSAGSYTAVAPSGVSFAVKADGSLYGFGVNANAQLGIGNTTSPQTSPVQVKDPSGTGYLTSIVAVSAGPSHTLALTSTGEVYGWGLNNVAQTGAGNTASPKTVPVLVPGLSNVVAVAAGRIHSLAVELRLREHDEPAEAAHGRQEPDSHLRLFPGQPCQADHLHERDDVNPDRKLHLRPYLRPDRFRRPKASESRRAAFWTARRATGFATGWRRVARKRRSAYDNVPSRIMQALLGVGRIGDPWSLARSGAAVQRPRRQRRRSRLPSPAQRCSVPVGRLISTGAVTFNIEHAPQILPYRRAGNSSTLMPAARISARNLPRQLG
jgi:hypothetical protein